MSLLHKSLDQITEADLQILVSTPVYESRVLDYKEQLPGDSSSEKKEFLYDITSFANSCGGELLYGISEERIDGKNTGKPSAMPGVNIENIDELIRKYENLIRTSVQPRIFGLQMKAIPLSNGNHVLLIRIPKSLNAPHMVTLEGNQRFYTRNSAGKHPMDITEIRSTILANSLLSERIRNFFLDRISKIKINQSLTKLENNSHFLLTILIPYSAFGIQQISPAELKEQVTKLAPLYSSGWDYKYNLEGIMTFAKSPVSQITYSYVQMYRNGIVESVDTGMLKPREDGKKVIPSVTIEKKLIERIFSYLEAQKAVGITPPIVIWISLINVMGFQFAVSNRFFPPDYAGIIEQEDVVLPEVIIEGFPQTLDELAKILQGTFDALWNAAGWPRSLNYNNEGNWVGQ